MKTLLVKGSNTVRYKHLTLESDEETIVDDIITLKGGEDSLVAAVEKLTSEIQKLTREQKKDRLVHCYLFHQTQH